METGGSRSGGSDGVHGLKFRNKIYFEQEVKGLATGVPPPAAPPRCQVEGCGVDLSGDSHYYRRHKVCSVHARTPRVVVAGIEQRFCQECSRFQELPEFDQGKRSCRRRLIGHELGHNEHLRKPPPGPLTSRYGRLAASLLAFALFGWLVYGGWC